MLSVTSLPCNTGLGPRPADTKVPRNQPGGRSQASLASPYIPLWSQLERSRGASLLPWQLSYRIGPRNRKRRVGVSELHGPRHSP